jgi:hypothetical protein
MPIYPEPYGDILLADGSPFDEENCFRNFVLQTEDPKELPLPSPFLLKTHYKLVNALHHFYVEERIAEGWPPLQSRCEFAIHPRSLRY